MPRCGALLQNYLEVIGLSNFLQRQHSFADEYVEEGFVHDALLEVGDGFTVLEQALLSLVMPG